MTPKQKQDVVENLQFVISMMELNYSIRTFFTAHMIVKNYLKMFPKCGLVGWEIRGLIKGPQFRLTHYGWRNF